MSECPYAGSESSEQEVPEVFSFPQFPDTQGWVSFCEVPKQEQIGKTTPQACKEAEITMQTFYRWRKEYGGLKLEQAKRLKDLEKENSRLKRLVAELSLEKQVLKDVASGNL
jgi:putative transposase